MSQQFKSNRWEKAKKRQSAIHNQQEKQRKRERKEKLTDVFDKNLEDELNQLDYEQQSNLSELNQTLASTSVSLVDQSTVSSSTSNQIPHTPGEVREHLNRPQSSNFEDFEIEGNYSFF